MQTAVLKMGAALLLVLLMNLAAFAAPKAELWPYWLANTPQNVTAVDHSAWADFLQEYVRVASDGTPNRLRYTAVSSDDAQALGDYLTLLAAVKVTQLNRAEQKAYWINLYNALTVKVVLDNFPVKSIREVKSGWFSAGPWDLKLIRVEGFELSLNDIEHRILRPIWKDNRIHYAVNCASMGCPDLQAKPFTAANSETLLDQAAVAYVNSPRGLRFVDDTLVLSRIYDWYQADFGGNEAALKNYLQTLAAPDLAARLRSFTGAISYDYDWTLNE
ncbi:MAG: DUF547 domain-containing protein [Deltaproteobacteria bacterium]|nr:DUF547 domain-containing protein [Deltaproteobacteria bacterium]